MDSAPRSTQACISPDLSVVVCPAETGPAGTIAPQALGDPGEDPYSPGPIPIPPFLGSVIALITLVVPLTLVLSGREPLPMAPLSQGAEPAAARSGWPMP